MAALFIIFKTWKQHKHPSMDERIKNMFSMHTHAHRFMHTHMYVCMYTHSGILFSFKNKRLFPFVKTPVFLESIVPKQ